MSSESVESDKKQRKTRVIHRGGASEAVYGFGLIGAWIYFFTHATTFWVGVLGFFKGIVWPAIVVFELLKFLQL